MKPYYNLPQEQHSVQHFVDAFNNAESLWYSLHDSRKRRRKRLLSITETEHQRLELLEFTTSEQSEFKSY